MLFSILVIATIAGLPTGVISAIDRPSFVAGMPDLYSEALILAINSTLAHIEFNVTALAQCSDNAIGPGYILAGRSDQGYWYEVGLAWNWPVSLDLNGGVANGFHSVYSAYSPSGTSQNINGHSNILNLLNGVNDGDLVQLGLSISNNDVLMSVHDWNSSITDRLSTSAYSAAQFVALPQAGFDSNGYYTGVATVEFHGSPFYGDEQRVVYKYPNIPQSSAWMRIEEHTNPGSGNVFNQKTLTNYNSSSQLQSLTYQGATEASNSTTFITGTQSTGPKCLAGSVSPLAVVIAIASLGGSAVVAGVICLAYFTRQKCRVGHLGMLNMLSRTVTVRQVLNSFGLFSHGQLCY